MRSRQNNSREQQHSIVEINEIPVTELFDFRSGDQPSSFETGFLPMKLRLITSKTLAGRVKRDFFWRIQVRNKGTDNMLKWITPDTREGNERIIQLTTTHSKRIAKQTAFVYSHLIMPHAPFALQYRKRALCQLC